MFSERDRMVSGASRQAERLEKKLQNALRECQKKPGNKRCADCTERVSRKLVLRHLYSTLEWRLGLKAESCEMFSFAKC